MLDNRLEKICECIKPCRLLADIGTDHGKLAVEIKLSGRAGRVIASDISDKSLEKAKKYSLKMHADIECVCADGLDGAEDADEIVIAGMGGLTIAGIIDKNPKKARAAFLVLSPHSEVHSLRKYLETTGFIITEECCVYHAGKYYPVICTEAGNMKLSEDDILFGRKEAVNPSEAYICFLNDYIRNTEKEINSMEKGGAPLKAIDEKKHIATLAERRLEWLNSLKK